MTRRAFPFVSLFVALTLMLTPVLGQAPLTSTPSGLPAPKMLRILRSPAADPYAGWEEVGTNSASGAGISDNNSDSWVPSMAIAPDGMPYVAWGDNGDGDWEIYVRQWNGSTWSEVGPGSASGGGISNGIAHSKHLPSLAIAQDGTPYVAWDNIYEIFVQRWNGSSWEEVGPGSASGTSDYSKDASLAIAPNGTAYVAWTESLGLLTNGHIYVRQWNGSAWTEVGTGSASGGGISNESARGSTMAIAPDGTPYVAWSDYSGSDGEIYVQRWNGGSWEEVGAGSASGGGISDNSGNSRNPEIAIAPSGTPYVVWYDDSGGDDEIYVRCWNGSSWEEVGTGSASGGGVSNNSSESTFASAAIAPDGTPYVAWRDGGDGDDEIYVRRWNGGSWEEVGTGSASGGGVSDNSGDSSKPSIAMAPDGMPYVAWYDYSGGDAEIYVRRWTGDGQDITAPAATIDLASSTGDMNGTVDLTWTAPGDDGNMGTASTYIVRHNTSQITEVNWGSSTDVSGEPEPSAAGSTESMTVSGLTPGQTYYFAIKSQDEVSNTSGISNSPHAVAGSSQDSFAVYLPFVGRNHVFYPSVDVRNHTSDADGRISVPLTGGGTAIFEFVDVLEQPVDNIPVVSMENEYGVTILAMAQQAGFTPLLASVPASEYKALGERSPQQFSIFTGFDFWQFDENVPIWIKLDYISGVLESLGRGAEEWFRHTMTPTNICTFAATGATIVVVHYSTSGLSIPEHVAVHGASHVVSHTTCHAFFSGSPAEQEYSVISNFDLNASQLASEEQPRTILVEWYPGLDNSTGIAFGRVVDRISGTGVEGVTVKLDDSPEYTFTTIRGGGYRFEGLAPGTHSLSAERAGYTSDSIVDVPVLANQMTEATDLEIEPVSWGVWRIENDTGGTLTIDLGTVGIRSFSPGVHDWVLVPGTYDFRAWTAACGGEVDSSIAIYVGYITGTGFICGPAALRMTMENTSPVDQ